jgi:hypothetical protein
MNYNSIGFQELYSVFGETKTSLPNDITRSLLRFNNCIITHSIGGDITGITYDNNGDLHTTEEDPIIFSCSYVESNKINLITMKIWYSHGKIHRNGDEGAVILSRNNCDFYEELWTNGEYKSSRNSRNSRNSRLKLQDLKYGIPHPRRPMRN